MDAREKFRELLKTDIGPVLRQEGFRGSGNTWRLRNEHGDWAIVNIQKSAWGSADDVAAYINLAIVLKPDWEFDTWSGRIRPAPQPSIHHGLWQRRLDPPHLKAGSIWDFGDGADQQQFSNRMIEALLNEGIPTLRSLLDRPTLVSRWTEHGDSFDGGHIRSSPEIARLVLLIDAGPSAELTSALTEFEATLDDQPESSSTYLQSVMAWAKARAQVR